MIVHVTLEVAIADDVDPHVFAERLFDALCADEMNQWPEIESVDGYDVRPAP